LYAIKILTRRPPEELVKLFTNAPMDLFIFAGNVVALSENARESSMKRSKLLHSIVIMTFAVHLWSQTSWVPYTAKLRETINNIYPGGKQETIVNEGIKARNSEGSILEEIYSPNSTKPDHGKLYIAPEGIAYTLNFPQNIAVGVHQKLGRMLEPKGQPIGRAVIGGVTATGYPMLSAQTKQPEGEIWIADGSDIIVKITSTAPGGSKYTQELLDVKIGEEPPNSLFSLPKSMAVSKPEK
jgi:hypothetical protein